MPGLDDGYDASKDKIEIIYSFARSGKVASVTTQGAMTDATEFTIVLDGTQYGSLEQVEALEQEMRDALDAAGHQDVVLHFPIKNAFEGPQVAPETVSQIKNVLDQLKAARIIDAWRIDISTGRKVWVVTPGPEASDEPISEQIILALGEKGITNIPMALEDDDISEDGWGSDNLN